jgi:retron-type reverse transcriptase
MIDIQKAFDCVGHDRLLDLLAKVGLADSTLRWFETYLSDRTQSTRIGNFLSNVRPLPIGCPQGTVLSPELFKIVINPVFYACPNLKPVAFADDGNYVAEISKNNITEDVASTNSSLEELSSWFNNSRLPINPEKSVVLIFSNLDPSLNEQINLMLNGILIPKKDCHKCLGVMVKTG